jgi:hypothetical protein
VLDGGMIWLQGTRRTVVLTSNGFPFASIPSGPVRSARRRFGPPGYPAADPAGDAVAFVRVRFRPGAMAVFLLRPGDRHARRLYRTRAQLGCGYGASLSWSGSNLLFTTDRGRVAVLDASGSRPPVDLTSVAHAMPTAARHNVSLQVAWG